MLTAILAMNSLRLLEKNLDHFSAAKQTMIDFEIEFLDPKDCKKLASYNQWQTNFTVNADDILEYSDLCAVAKFNGVIAHWTQIAFNSVYTAEIDKDIFVSSKSAYLYGIYTSKDFRRKGLASAVTQKTFAYLSDKGIRRIYMAVDPHNHSMLRIAAKAGFKEIGRITVIKMGKLRLYRCKGDIKKFMKSKSKYDLLNSENRGSQKFQDYF